MHRAKVVATQNFVNLDLASLSATPTELFGHGASDNHDVMTVVEFQDFYIQIKVCHCFTE